MKIAVAAVAAGLSLHAGQTPRQNRSFDKDSACGLPTVVDGSAPLTFPLLGTDRGVVLTYHRLPDVPSVCVTLFKIRF